MDSRRMKNITWFYQIPRMTTELTSTFSSYSKSNSIELPRKTCPIVAHAGLFALKGSLLFYQRRFWSISQDEPAQFAKSITVSMGGGRFSVLIDTKVSYLTVPQPSFVCLPWTSFPRSEPVFAKNKLAEILPVRFWAIQGKTDFQTSLIGDQIFRLVYPWKYWRHWKVCG